MENRPALECFRELLAVLYGMVILEEMILLERDGRHPIFTPDYTERACQNALNFIQETYRLANT